MDNSNYIAALIKQGPLVGRKNNFILLDDYVSFSDFDKSYAVVKSNLFFENNSLFDVVLATTNLISTLSSSTYFIPIVSSEKVGNLHRTDVVKSFNVSSPYVFSKSKKEDYPELRGIDDFGFYKNKLDFSVYSLLDLGLDRFDLNSVESVLKQYSSKQRF